MPRQARGFLLVRALREQVMRSEQCILCKHFRVNETCEAFPAGIPPEIRSGAFDHTKPYPGDNGVRYDPLAVEPGPQAG